MKQEIFTCDRCKKVIKTAADLTEVGAGKREHSYNRCSGGSSYTFYQLFADWCLECCIEVGIAKKDKSFPINPTHF